jgi:hypothetical protein
MCDRGMGERLLDRPVLSLQDVLLKVITGNISNGTCNNAQPQVRRHEDRQILVGRALGVAIIVNSCDSVMGSVLRNAERMPKFLNS